LTKSRPAMHVIVGLGNPGARYQGTRHNVGFHCVDKLGEAWGIRQSDKRAKAVLGQGHRGGQPVVLAKPRTFVNNSGESIAYLMARFGVRPQDLVIVYDDMELAVGRLRIRPAGSDGGHNGIRSIISTLQTQNFPRIRVGIGSPAPGEDWVSHVLGRFSEDEAKVIADAEARVIEAINCILDESIDAAMNRFNRTPE
jgi:PTH1 family peptidyl-tRNA hydrolase